MSEEEKEISLDILHHVEHLSEQINRVMASTTRSVFRRYPLTFTLLVLFGVVAVSEGARGVLESFEMFDNHPWYLLMVGLVILIITGTLYKKLDKRVE